jgi:hypothetical protein
METAVGLSFMNTGIYYYVNQIILLEGLYFFGYGVGSSCSYALFKLVPCFTSKTS